MSASSQFKQSDHSIAKNTSFFRDQLEAYKSKVNALDTYRNISASINAELSGIHHLLDIGNGGTFDYDVSLLPELAAVDLFLEDLPSGSFPPNVVPRNGSALNLPFSDASFDGVIMVMLIHHLVGNSISACWENAGRAVDEAFRVLKPSGKLIVMESCVPRWFYGFEKLVFPLAAKLIGRISDHPATLQFPPAMISDLLRRHAANVEVVRVPTGRWVLQYGIQYPSALTPAAPHRFVTYKS
jgi:SAM-dependent methyltransferase